MARPTDGAAEYEKQNFLPGGAKKVSKTRWSKKKICLISCLSCVLLVLIVLGGGAIYIFTRGTVVTTDTRQWEALLNTTDIDPTQIDPSGMYVLMSFDDQYAEYLKAMGIPFFVVPPILAGSEKIEIVMPPAEGEKVMMRTITDYVTRESEFYFGQEFSMTYGKGSMSGEMVNICTRPQHNQIHCKSEEKERQWHFISDLTFTGNGMINKRIFLTKNIETKKFYQKEGAQEDGNLRKGQEPVSEPPRDYSLNEDSEEEDEWFAD